MKIFRDNSISAFDFGESIVIVQIFEARAASIFGIRQSSNRTIVKLKFRNVCFVQDSRNLICICLTQLPDTKRIAFDENCFFRT